jgi:hypothetical protein
MMETAKERKSATSVSRRGYYSKNFNGGSHRVFGKQRFQF